MSTTADFTTVHGSDLIGLSDVFCCAVCGAQVALVLTVGGEMCYECQSTRCGKTVSADISEGLAVRDDLAIELPAPRVRVEYTSALGSIPAAIERFKSAGRAGERGARRSSWREESRQTRPTVLRWRWRVLLPVHRKPLSEGRYGLYCSAKAKPGEEQNDKGYCALKFVEE